MSLLPSVNYNATPGFNEFEFLHTIYSQEFQNRSKIAAETGIVDFSGNPAASPFSANRPLSVQISTADPLSIDISAGNAVTPNHNLVLVDSSIPSVPLPDLTADKVYVVAVEYKLIPSEETRINRFGIPSEVRLERPTNSPYGGGASTIIDAITVASITDYNNPALFSSERKKDIVVIAIVTSQSDPITGQLSLTADLTQNNYDFNRPWFSIVDVSHRSKVGSGVVADNNPHGIELQDLSSAGFTLYQQFNGRGGVFSKDSIYYGYPGKICSELLTVGRFEPDYTGTVTNVNGDALPLAGRYFARLTNLPSRVGSCYFTETPWNPIPYEWIPGTRIIVLGALEDPTLYTNTVVIEYFTVSALAMGSESLTQGVQTLEVLSPEVGQEFIISSGIALDTLIQNTIPLPSTLGPIKRSYQVLCESTGALVLNPQPLVSVQKISDLVNQNIVAVNQTPHNGLGVTLTLGLTRTAETSISTGFDLNLKVKIQGLDESGAAAEELVTFRASQWRDQSSTENFEEPLQFQTTKTKFSQISNFKLMNTAADPDNCGPDALISLWANILEHKDNQEMANVTSFFWTGTTGINFRDERLIGTTIQRNDQKAYRFPTQLPENDAAFTQELFSVLLDPPLTDPENQSKRLALELDDDRYWGETWKSFSTRDASASIVLSSYTLITPGLTLRIGDGKYLSFEQEGVTVSVVDPEKGQIAIMASDTDQRNAIISTINNPSFDSTWFSQIGAGTPPPLSLSRRQAYPAGFVTCIRKELNFGASLTSGTFTCKVNGVSIGIIPAQLTHSATIDDIVVAINNITIDTGVKAVKIQKPINSIMFNGDVDGYDFSVTDILLTAPITSQLTTPTDAFVLSTPIGGMLSTSHLPNRYLSAQSKWKYLMRPMSWEGVFLRASIGFTNDSPATLANLDQVEITPGKILVAVTDPNAVDPSIGKFLATPSSLALTLDSIIATVNNVKFAPGCRASLSDDGKRVLLDLGGIASTSITPLVESIPNTWDIEDYAPVGGGDALAHGFLKSIHQLTSAEWRFQTVEDQGYWSEWMPMSQLSDTAFTFDGPTGFSLYTIQIRLEGQAGKPNGFSLYRVTPQVSGATIASLDVRLTAAEAILVDATGTAASLDARLMAVVDDAGVRVQDTELTAARTGVITSTATSLKSRLDGMDAWNYWKLAKTGGSIGGSLPTDAADFSMANQLISGPVIATANTMTASNFITQAGNTLIVGGTSTVPLVYRYGGLAYRSATPQTLDFTGKLDGTWYIVATRPSGSEMGLTLASANTGASIADGASVLTSGSAFSVTNAMLAYLPLVVYVPSITVGGRPLVAPIASIISNTSLSITGKFPSIPTGTPFEIRSFQELPFSLTQTAPSWNPTSASQPLYFGMAVWTLSAFSEVRSFAYQGRFDGKLLTATANFTLTIDHNLGVIPKQFTLYYHEALTGDATPKVLHIGDEVVVKSSANQMWIKNRYDGLTARKFDGTAMSTGYIQLII